MHCLRKPGLAAAADARRGGAGQRVHAVHHAHRQRRSGLGQRCWGKRPPGDQGAGQRGRWYAKVQNLRYGPKLGVEPELKAGRLNGNMHVFCITQMAYSDRLRGRQNIVCHTRFQARFQMREILNKKWLDE